MVKTFEEREAIRNRWMLRGIMNKIQALLPEGYIATNSKPVKKEICHKSSCGKAIYWSSWCKNGKERYLALLDGDRVKLIAENEIKEAYKVKTVT